jgi:chromosome segregation ATPase
LNFQAKTRPKSKSITSNTASQNGVETSPNNNDTSGELIGEQNEIISKIEELLSFLTLNSSEFKESMSTALNLTNAEQSTPPSSSASSTTPLTYAEMLAMYEKEKTVRLDMETNFQQKAKDSVKQIENLNRDITSMSTVIDELRKQYVSLQSQYQFQLDSLIKLNEEIRVDMHQTENRNEHLKSENLKLKAENKQLYGEQTSLGKELDEQYKHVPNSLEEATRQLNNLKADMIKAVMVNQALNKQLNLSSENIKHLTKVLIMSFV